MAVEVSGLKQPGNIVFLEADDRASVRPPKPAGRAEQLAIEFDQPQKLLVVVSERLHGATFLRCLVQKRPKLLVDFRFAPHFRFTAVDGAVVKRQIDAAGVRYIQCPIPFHKFGTSLLRHDPKGIAVRLPASARAHGKTQGPFMVLVNEIRIAHAMSPFLLDALQHDLGGKWDSEIVA